MLYPNGRSWARLAIDLAWVALSPFVALIIRENFEIWVPKLQALVPYAGVCVVSAVFVFNIGRLNRTFWRYISLIDVLHLMSVVTIALLLALLGTFVLNRLEGVARSLPVIQWFVLIALMTGSRMAARLLFQRNRKKGRQLASMPNAAHHVLIVGVTDLTDLYLRAIAEFAPDRFIVAGILTDEPLLHGRSLRALKVLGKPQDTREVVNQLDVHGVMVDRIIVATPFENLSKETQDALRTVELSSAIRIDWLIENLGFDDQRTSAAGEPDKVPSRTKEAEFSSIAQQNEYVEVGQYHRLKRAIEGIVAACALIALTPVLAITALLVAIDVGFPLVFWQQRPGRYGYPFKIFKFRTMRAAHDVNGNRIPDELRSSIIGRFLRRFWLDELPQLYNIMIGEMSFVGPRPLLPVDQPIGQVWRLAVRPGLTGWAQINGGRDLSSEEKASLDIWYVENASLWLDSKILFATARILLSGGQLNTGAQPKVEATTSADGTSDGQARLSTGTSAIARASPR